MKIQEFVDKSLILAVGFAYENVRLELERKLRAENCNFVQAMILIAAFFEKEKTVTPTKLARVLRATPANLSHCISALERRGLLKRELNPDDARSYRIALRPEGRKTALRVVRIIDRFERKFDERHGRDHVQQLVNAIREISAF